MRSIKMVRLLAIAIAIASLGVLSGCGPAEEPSKPVENAQKGEGASADGAANQSGAVQEGEATE